MKLNILTAAVLLVIAGALILHPPPIVWTPTHILGAVLALPSILLVLLARWQLGASFSVSAQAHRLVTTGLYRRIRNPIYVFSGTFLAGVSLFWSPWGPLAVAAILIPLQITRARNEAKVLHAAFGDEYLRYKQQTWF